MENFIWVVLPLVMTGLGFITYRHPPIARKLVTYMMVATGVVFFMEGFYNIGQHNAFFDSLNAARITIYKYDPLADTSNNLSNIRNFDSLKIASDRHRLESNYKFAISHNEKVVKDSITNVITLDQQNEIKWDHSFNLWCGIAYCILFIFMMLTYVFEPLWKPNSSTQNNSASKIP
jgi:hypothetical protein